MTKQFTTLNYGIVNVRNVMLKGEFNSLGEGIEITGDEIELITIEQYYDLDEMGVVTLVNLIENN